MLVGGTRPNSVKQMALRQLGSLLRMDEAALCQVGLEEGKPKSYANQVTNIKT